MSNILTELNHNEVRTFFPHLFCLLRVFILFIVCFFYESQSHTAAFTPNSDVLTMLLDSNRFIFSNLLVAVGLV